MGTRNRFNNLFINSENNNDVIDYCDKCDLCIRNSMIPSRGNGVDTRGTILHLVTAPSPADNKSKIILSGNTGKFVRKLLEDRLLLSKSYFTSIVKCGIYSQVNSQAIKSCFPRLKSEIEHLDPSMFITYGKDPYFIITGKPFPKDNEGIEILNNGKVLIYTISLEYMKFLDDYRYLDRAYENAIIAYRKHINPWTVFR